MFSNNFVQTSLTLVFQSSVVQGRLKYFVFWYRSYTTYTIYRYQTYCLYIIIILYTYNVQFKVITNICITSHLY